MDLTRILFEKAHLHVDEGDSRKVRNSTGSTAFIKSTYVQVSACREECLKVLERLKQQSPLYIVNIDKKVSLVEYPDTQCSVLQSYGIRPYGGDENMDKLNIGSKHSFQTGQSHIHVNQVDKYIQEFLVATRSTINGLFVTLNTREEVLKNALKLDMSVLAKGVKGMQYSFGIGRDDKDLNSEDVDAWMYVTDTNSRITGKYPIYNENGSLKNTHLLSNDGKGSFRVQAIMDGPTQSDIEHRRVILSDLEVLCLEIAEKMKDMKEDRRENLLSGMDSHSIHTAAAKTQLDASQRLEEVDKDDLETLEKLGIGKEQIMLEHTKFVEAEDENLQMVQHIEHTMGQINDLIKDFAMHVTMQAETVDTIVDNTEQSNITIQEGNKELRKALDRGGACANLYTIYFVTATIIQLVYNWIK